MPRANTSAEQSRGMLQICPSDVPPFAELCQAYSSAAQSLGVPNHIIYLAPPVRSHSDQPIGSHISHLHMDDLTNHSVAAERLGRACPFPNPRLILCHRYRSYRVARVADLPQERSIAIAHEFGLLRRWQRRLDRALSARTLRFAGISPAVVADLENTVSQALLLPNIIDWAKVERRQLDRAEARSHLGIVNDHFCIGVVGRLHRKKRPSLAIDAMAALGGTQPPTELLFIGDGDLRDALAAQAAALQTQGQHIRFAGFVADARRYFSGLDALLLTSSSAEAFGMVALEALAVGLPVIAADVPGVRSVLGELGFYASENPTAEELATQIRKVQALIRMGELDAWQAEAGARVRKEFSISAGAQRLQPLLAMPKT
ncbi:MAG: glycosyltransferase family 4 protein [Pseudomonadales bacterium]